MAKRRFRTEESLRAEGETRDRVPALLMRHGFDILDEARITRGTATTQTITARNNEEVYKMRVRLCWRRSGRSAREGQYSGAQLRARLVDDDWEKTLDFIAERERKAGNTHNLFVQMHESSFSLAALVPSDQIPEIWRRQRDISEEIISRGEAGIMRRNHAKLGASPSIWLQDDRTPASPAVADVLWSWPGVINVLSLPLTDVDQAPADDTYDDLPFIFEEVGRDDASPTSQFRSGYPRDPTVRAEVRRRANGRCEREECSEQRDYPGFLDVHHILGIGKSDRVWSCVALCPNCHREAHFAPDKDQINKQLLELAKRFS